MSTEEENKKAREEWEAKYKAEEEAKRKAEDKARKALEKIWLNDLTPICREEGRALTHVRIDLDSYLSRGVPWLTAGASEFQRFDSLCYWTLGARMEGATDFEHDSAWAFKLPLIGLEFKHAYDQGCHFTAFVHPDGFDDFHVPPIGYDPRKLPEAHQCKEKGCRRNDEKHIIVPEGYYVPAKDAELYKKVRGKRVDIVVGLDYRKRK